MARLAPFRVRLWDIGSNRGRGNLVAIIDDAKDVGGSQYANDGGEFFMTLPWNHPLINECQPLERHYEVARLNQSAGTYTPIFVGLLDDFSASKHEVVVYGSDYMTLLSTSITGASTSYSSQSVSSIIAAELSVAIRGQTGTAIHANSRMGFITEGTINNTSKTTTVISSFESRLSFLQSLVGILQDGGTTRPLIWISRQSPFTIRFDDNHGSDVEAVRLELGGLVNDFLYDPGYSRIATTVKAIGQKREGATLLFSSQSYAPEATYGRIERPLLKLDVINQTALDEWTRTQARRMGRVGQEVGLVIESNSLAPWDGYDLTDSVRVILSRGLVDVDNLFTIWGLEWIGKRNGSESLYLDLLLKDQ